MKNRISSLFVVPAYVAGVVVGLFLVVVATWADMESAFYGFSRLAEAGLRGFSCPAVMTRTETGTITLNVSNPTDNLLRPTVRTMISTATLVDEFQETLELAPGESKRLEWSVDPGNIDLKRFIFAKVVFYSAYPLPSREATCGVFILDLPGTGKVVLPLLILVSLLCMGWGLYEMKRISTLGDWLEKHVRPLTFLSVVIALGLAVSIFGGWVPSIILLAVALLMIFIVLGSLFMSERRRR